MNIKVSVIVATYRRNSALERALCSLASQTCDSFEIIVVDDNDEKKWNQTVKKIILRVQEKYPNLKITCIENHPNLGSAKARNAGIEKADGEFITFLDDDDIYMPEKIEQQMLDMCSNKADYSVTDLELYYDDGNFCEKRVRSYIKYTDMEHLLKYNLLYHITGTDTMMFKRGYLQEIGGFAHIDVGDEFYLMQRAIEGGGKFTYLNRSDVKAYVHRGELGGLSSGWKKIEGENNLYCYKKKYFEWLDKKERRYVKMRHYAVLAFANARMKRFFKTVKNLIFSFATAPIQCIELYMSRKR